MTKEKKPKIKFLVLRYMSYEEEEECIKAVDLCNDEHKIPIYQLLYISTCCRGLKLAYYDLEISYKPHKPFV